MHGERSAFTAEGKKHRRADAPHRATRGYDARGSLWSPGYYRVDLRRGKDAALVASTESWDTISALAPGQALMADGSGERLLAQAHPAAQHGLPRSSCWRPISSSSRRPAASRMPRAAAPPATKSGR